MIDMSKVISTGCKTIDNVMNGGVPLGTPVGFYGIQNIGKSLLATQTAIRFASEGYDVIYLDTEAFYQLDEDWNRITGWFIKRWNLDESVRDRIHLKQMRDLFALGRYFGIEFQIVQEQARISAMAKFPKKWGEKDTKVTHQSQNWITYSQAYKDLISLDKPGLVIIDSITVPIKSKIASTTQNFPARASLLQTLLDVALVTANEFNIGFIVTNHGTKNPMGYGVQPWGGANMIYYVKRWIGLLDGLKADREVYGEQVRRVYRYRWPGLMEIMSRVLLAKDTGYIDVGQPDTGGVTIE